uniref:BH3-interacting domain death agonist n=1 Tax=Nothobranchius kadleci TaxID=1051664 RepID=A0A1A8DX21_NOTKA|nr:BH3 interacting domain death agonist isoform X1 [Nothobranchius furzeri]XP_054589474.1 BH3 interacting domain death agonist isoform X1 [Nothobranchius furzeri]
MDISGSLANSEDAARVIVAFLQADCIDQLYRNELISLCNELAVEWAINRHEHQVNTPDHGELEADGHLPGRITLSIDDIQPQVDPQPLAAGHAGELVDFQAVAEGLREIAAQFEHNVVTQATQNLSRKISRSPSEHWKDHLADEVDQLMKRGVVLEHLHQERVIMALTLTLVKGICVQTPQLLRMLFTTVHQLVCCAGSR